MCKECNAAWFPNPAQNDTHAYCTVYDPDREDKGLSTDSESGEWCEVVGCWDDCDGYEPIE